MLTVGFIGVTGQFFQNKAYFWLVKSACSAWLLLAQVITTLMLIHRRAVYHGGQPLCHRSRV